MIVQKDGRLSKPAIFISYRRSDTNRIAALLSKSVKQHLPGLDVFLDVTDIEP